MNPLYALRVLVGRAAMSLLPEKTRRALRVDGFVSALGEVINKHNNFTQAINDPNLDQYALGVYQITMETCYPTLAPLEQLIVEHMQTLPLFVLPQDVEELWEAGRLAGLRQEQISYIQLALFGQ